MSSQDFFKKFSYKKRDIENYIKNAAEDLEIAKNSTEPKVKILFSYNALIKSGIAAIAYKKKSRVRSRRGHHVKIIEALSEILGDKDIAAIGNTIRKKRNSDLYFASSLFTEKEAKEYYDFVESVKNKVASLVK